MARSSAIYYQAYNGLTIYKAWVQPISTALNAVATRTADTGQVNWATIPNEPTVVRDYEIFAMGGPLQATAPIFIRVDYTGGTAGNIAVTVGTTTDGAGNLGGLLVAKQLLQNYPVTLNSSTIPQWVWTAHDTDGSYFTFTHNLDPSASGPDGAAIVVVERTRDNAGAATGAGFHVWRWWGFNTTQPSYIGCWTKTFGAAQQTPNADMVPVAMFPDFWNTNTAYISPTSYAYPVYTYTVPLVKGASKALLFSYPYDFPRGQPATVPHYGEQMTFIPMSDAVPTPFPVYNTSGTLNNKNMSPLIRWD